MGNLLNSISLFIARRTEAAPQGDAARSTVVGAGQPMAPQVTSLPPPMDESSPPDAVHRASPVGRSGGGENLDLYHDDFAQASERPLPLMTYPTQHGEVAQSKVRRSRALNVLRTSTSIALPARPMPLTQTGVGRQHGLHLARILLTETERIRLQVMQVQIRLSGLSLYEGPIDGTLNPETVTGVRHFQTLKGMRATGTLAAGTLSALGVPPIG
jgi:Putative peptidoglycan binding domain